MLKCISKKYYDVDIRNYQIEISYNLPKKIDGKNVFIVVSVYNAYVSAYVKINTSWFHYITDKNKFQSNYYNTKIEQNFVEATPSKLMQLCLLHACMIQTEVYKKMRKTQSTEIIKLISKLIVDIFGEQQ